MAFPGGGALGAGGPMYDYFFLDLNPAPGPSAILDFAEQLKAGRSRDEEILGLFQPQLGWRSRQAAVLMRRGAGAPATPWMTAGPAIANIVHDRLTATVRPTATDRPAPGGIYVHRWFAVIADAVPEFVDLSVQGWRDFEARFDTRIFGLFESERCEEDRRRGATLLLLITRYKDHGVWEASRDPTTDAMAAFARRRRLTLDSWAASTLLMPL